MSDLTFSDAVGDEAVALLPSQHAQATNLKALIRALVTSSLSMSAAIGSAIIGYSGIGGGGTDDLSGQQSLIDALKWMYTYRWPSAAYSFLLDWVGDIVGCKRGFSSDEDYRKAIYLHIDINTAQGAPARIISIAKRLSAATLVVFKRKQPAAMHLWCYRLTSWNQLGRVQEASGAGKRVIISGSRGSTPFMFGPDKDHTGNEHGTALDIGSGYGEYTMSGRGGTFSEVYSH